MRKGENNDSRKTETLNARIEPTLKNNAEQILKKLGLSNAEAIRLFYTQICLNKGLPFSIKLPNEKTKAAMYDADARNTFTVNSIDELFKE